MPDDQPQPLVTRFPKNTDGFTEGILVHAIRATHDNYPRERAGEYAAGIMEELARPSVTTEQVLKLCLNGMIEPFTKTVRELAIVYSEGKGPEANRLYLQITGEHGRDIPKIRSLMAQFNLETADAAIFDVLAQHAQRVQDFQKRPREQVTANLLEILHDTTRLEMAEVLDICSRIEGWGVDSSAAAPPKPVRAPAEGEIPLRTEYPWGTYPAHPPRGERHRRS